MAGHVIPGNRVEGQCFGVAPFARCLRPLIGGAPLNPADGHHLPATSLHRAKQAERGAPSMAQPIRARLGPAMRYDERDKQSENVEDRRGQGGGGFGFPGGGGIQIPLGGGRGGFSLTTMLIIGATHAAVRVQSARYPDRWRWWRQHAEPAADAAGRPGRTHRQRPDHTGSARAQWPAQSGPASAGRDEGVRLARPQRHRGRLGPSVRGVRPALHEAAAGAVLRSHSNGLRHRHVGDGAVLLPGRSEGLCRSRFL